MTNYPAGKQLLFDFYQSQSVLVFEEFRSQIPISDMLNYLDVYPLMLPARYFNRVACYETIYITSNLSLEEQYKSVQNSSPKTWEAFLRRITDVWEFKENGKIIKTKLTTKKRSAFI